MRAAAVVVLVAALAGCGGSGDDEAEVEPIVTTTTPPPAETTTTTIDAEGISELEALAPELLVRADELSVAGLQDLGYTPPGSPPGCDFVLDEEVPPDLHVGTMVGLDDVPAVTEVIRLYTDTATATVAFDAAVANEAPCRLVYQAFTGPTDVNDRIGADRAVSFSMLDRGGPTEVFHVLVGDALVSFEIRASVEPGPAAIDVAAFGVGKILAALEA